MLSEILGASADVDEGVTVVVGILCILLKGDFEDKILSLSSFSEFEMGVIVGAELEPGDEGLFPGSGSLSSSLLERSALSSVIITGGSGSGSGTI